MNKRKMPKKNAYEIKKDVAYFTKNRLPAFILAGLIIFWTIASVLGIIAFARGEKPSPKGLVTASAETAQDMGRQEIIIELSPYLQGLTFYGQDGTYVLKDTFKLVFGEGFFAYSKNVAYNDYSNQFYSSTFYEVDGSTFDVSYRFRLDYNYTPINYFQVWDEINIKCATINNGSYKGVGFSVRFISGANVVNVAFVLEFDLMDIQPSYFIMPNQNAHLPISSNISTNWDSAYGFVLDEAIKYYDFYQNYYNSIDNLYQEGYDEGYDDGRDIGRQEGYQNGLRDGREENNPYTFNALISSVIDVPIKAFTSLFDFEILGINIAQFALSLLTLCVVLAVVKLLL